jgi:hypothetical protein
VLTCEEGAKDMLGLDWTTLGRWEELEAGGWLGVKRGHSEGGLGGDICEVANSLSDVSIFTGSGTCIMRVCYRICNDDSRGCRYQGEAPDYMVWCRREG